MPVDDEVDDLSVYQFVGGFVSACWRQDDGCQCLCDDEQCYTVSDGSVIGMSTCIDMCQETSFDMFVDAHLAQQEEQDAVYIDPDDEVDIVDDQVDSDVEMDT